MHLTWYNPTYGVVGWDEPVGQLLLIVNECHVEIDGSAHVPQVGRRTAEGGEGTRGKKEHP